jgi:hypothetical protein
VVYGDHWCKLGASKLSYGTGLSCVPLAGGAGADDGVIEQELSGSSDPLSVRPGPVDSDSEGDTARDGEGDTMGDTVRETQWETQ